MQVLLLYLGVLRSGGGGGGLSSCQHCFLPMYFCIYGAILNLKALCFGVIPYIKIECIVYGSVPPLGPSKGPHNLISTVHNVS